MGGLPQDPDLIANAIMLHNVVDLTSVLTEMNAEGKETTKELVAGLTPYIRDQIRRFGRYDVNMDEYPPDLNHMQVKIRE